MVRRPPGRMIARRGDRCGTSGPMTADAPEATTTGPRPGKLTATDGATIEYFTCGDPSSPALMLSPAFTGSALLYVEKFGAALPDYHVVGVQLRAHGHGG